MVLACIPVIDTIDLLSAWSLERSAILLGRIADALGNTEVFPFERSMPEKFIGELDEYVSSSKKLILSAHNWIFVMEQWGLVCFGKVQTSPHKLFNIFNVY